ncbi:MAG: tyrosine-type recombinase/integrase [Planctomycetota bacterium]
MKARNPNHLENRDQYFTAAAALPPGMVEEAAAVGQGVEKQSKLRRPRKRRSGGKPYPTFPLTPHPNGQFCKKIRGKTHYFGTVNDPDAALSEYRRWCDALHSGKVARVTRTVELTAADLANKYLAAKERKRENGELTPAAFVEYHRHCERFIEFFGGQREVKTITRGDLEDYRVFLGRGTNATTLSNRIGGARSILKFAYENELIENPVRFGEAFKRPERRLLRRAKAQSGRTHFHAEEIRKILAVAPTCLQAMILLGINCAHGNTDIGSLPAACIDLERGRVDYPRAKTGIDRRCPLWPETIEAIRAGIAEIERWRVVRDPTATGLLFVTRNGLPCVRSKFGTSRNGRPSIVLHDSITTAMQKAMEKAGVKQPGLGFYGLRRSFETIGSETGNQVAVDHIMGHAPLSSDMGAVYRKHVADDALLQVTDHVRKWLWGGRPPGFKAQDRATIKSTSSRGMKKRSAARAAG